MSNALRGITVDDVFSAFPNAIVSSVWQIGQVQRGTEIGTTFEVVADLDVIVDEETDGDTMTSPSAEGLTTGTLLYCRPNQLPTLDTSVLIASYMVLNSDNEQYYAIEQAGVGKNQEAGVIEHVELRIRPTEVADVITG